MKFTDPKVRPPALSVVAEKIPIELREHPHWVVWKWVWNSGRGQWDKPPLRVQGGFASTTNPATWSDFNTALKAYRLGGWDGLGFVFTRSLGLVGVDFDNCRNADTGELAGWAFAWLKDLQTYVEISPSGTGVRALAVAKLPERGAKKGDLELYSDVRYLTITGQRLSRRHYRPEARQEVIDRLWREVRAERRETAQPRHTSHIAVEDREIVDLLRGETYNKGRRLFDGDTAGYPSASEADSALACKLAFYTKDPSQIERIWRASGLWRGKAAERQDYVSRTIANALEMVTETYHGCHQEAS